MSGPLLLPAAGDEPAPTFVLERIDGPPMTVELVGVEKTWQLRFKTGGAELTLAADEVVALRRTLLPAGAADKSRRFLLAADGDCLQFGRIVSGSADVWRVQSQLLGEIEVPLESLVAAVFDVPDAPDAVEQLGRRLKRQRRSQDVVRFRNGDELSGTLQKLEVDKLYIDIGKSVRVVSLESVASVALMSELPTSPKHAGLAAETTLADGSRLTLISLALEAGKLVGRTRWGMQASVALDRVVQVRFQGGRVVDLSDLEPASYQGTRYLDLDWPYRRDRSVGDKPLSIGGKRYAKGIGMHSPAELTYELGGRYRRFQATVGLDDSAGAAGSVVCRVLVDGREVFASPVLRGGGALEKVDLDVTGAKKLTLVVDMADRGYVLDHADWADARLVK